MQPVKPTKHNIAIFASGEGTNALNIIHHFKNSKKVNVALVVSNRDDAPVLMKAVAENVPVLFLRNKEYFTTIECTEIFKKEKIDLIVLAGFLWLVPTTLIRAFPNKIVNIHPALLPKYGGKGMYGINVHKAVLENKEKESGISIHYVIEKFDEGKIIFQARCAISPNETSVSLSKKIQALEHEHYPKVIENLLPDFSF